MSNGDRSVGVTNFLVASRRWTPACNTLVLVCEEWDHHTWKADDADAPTQMTWTARDCMIADNKKELKIYYKKPGLPGTHSSKPKEKSHNMCT